MTLLAVRHVTTYCYKQPVSFGEHRIMFRPRDSYDQRLLDARIEIDPPPSEMRWIHDVFGNCVAIARFSKEASELRFESNIRLDHQPSNAPDFQMEDYAQTYPFAYWSAPCEVVLPDVWLSSRMEDERMSKKRHTAEEIVAKLRQVDVLTAQGRTVGEAIRQIGVTEVTYYRWRSEYGGLKSDQVKRLKELEAENARLRRAVSDLTLDKMILKEAAKGNF
jgi:transposase-like protein